MIRGPVAVSSASAILDAGGMVARELERSLCTCMDDLLPGQVLLVITHTSEGSMAVPRWCQATGHRLLRPSDGMPGGEFQIYKE